MLTGKLIDWGFTRDSAVFVWGKVVGVLVFLATIGGDVAQTTYGIPSKWFHGIQILAAWIAYFSAQKGTSDLPAKKLWAGVLAVVLAGTMLSACGKVRHVATLADAAMAQLVFAVDDAEFAAHAQHVISDADHAKLDPIIRKALKDVRAVTAAIQGAPATGGVPATISDVLQDLQAAQAILQQLAQSPDLAPLIARVQAAIAKAGGQ